MFKSIRVIAGNLKNIAFLISLNCIHLILKGTPLGIMFFIITELIKPVEEMNGKKIIALMALMGIVMIISLFVAIKSHVRAFINSYTLATKTRLKLGDHLRKLSLGFFKKRDPGDISSLLLQDMAKVEAIFSHFLIDSVSCIILPLLMISFFIFVEIKLTMIMVLSVFLAVPALIAGNKIISGVGKNHIKTRNQVASRLLEYIQGIKTLSAFNQTGKGFESLDLVLKKFCRDSIRLEASAGAPVMLYSLILESGFLLVASYGFYLFSTGNLSAEVLMIFLIIGYKFFEPLLNFGIFVSEMRYMNLAAERITDVMDTKPLEEAGNYLEPNGFDIEFEKVDFGYGQRKVIKGLSAKFNQNSITALVGPSGSGKTTLTSLIARFWDVDNGIISIGGADISKINIEKLNSMLSVVFQDVYLFQDTILNNIKVGKKDATYEEVVDAAKRAGCHGFISQFKNGYETMAGEGGAMLSGGEKQRISIARALLKDAPIVLLDEATASLDPENELLVQNAIGEMIRSKTLIVIAHRLKTIQKADNIIVLEDGNIIEQGKHEELIDNNGTYNRLWSEQQKAGGWKFKT